MICQNCGLWQKDFVRRLKPFKEARRGQTACTKIPKDRMYQTTMNPCSSGQTTYTKKIRTLAPLGTRVFCLQCWKCPLFWQTNILISYMSSRCALVFVNKWHELDSEFFFNPMKELLYPYWVPCKYQPNMPSLLPGFSESKHYTLQCNARPVVVSMVWAFLIELLQDYVLMCAIGWALLN